MNKEIREQLEQDTMDYLAGLDFIQIDNDDDEFLTNWACEYNHLQRERFYHLYWSEILYSEKSYRSAKEYRELAHRYHHISLGMDYALECAGYSADLAGWITGEGRFKGNDFPVYKISKRCCTAATLVCQ